MVILLLIPKNWNEPVFGSQQSYLSSETAKYNSANSFLMIKTLVLGVGNILLGDEGIGVHALNEIKQRYSFNPEVEIIDGGTMGLDLLPFIEGRKNLLILDAVNLGKSPGVIQVIEGNNIPKILRTKLSVHQIGLPDMLAAAEIMGIVPEELCLIGIQPETIETGIGLSESVESRMDDIISAVLKKLDEWGIKSEQKRDF